MDYRSILVQVDSTRGANARLAAASRIAAASRAVLSGVFLKSGYITPSGVIAPVAAADALFAEERRKTAEVSAAARKTFDALAREGGVETSWSDINGDFDDDLISQARFHDLAILPRRMKTVTGDHTILAERIGMTCGGPVLVLPDGGYPWDFGRKIILAWKDGREAARVLRDAWPFLRTAEEIHVVTAARGGERHVDSLLQKQLELHGCRPARLTLDRDTDRPAGELIRQHIDLLGADMVVLGLFGHSRLQEFVLGGVSQHLLDHSSMPLLMSH